MNTPTLAVVRQLFGAEWVETHNRLVEPLGTPGHRCRQSPAARRRGIRPSGCDLRSGQKALRSAFIFQGREVRNALRGSGSKVAHRKARTIGELSPSTDLAAQGAGVHWTVVWALPRTFGVPPPPEPFEAALVEFFRIGCLVAAVQRFAEEGTTRIAALLKKCFRMVSTPGDVIHHGRCRKAIHALSASLTKARPCQCPGLARARPGARGRWPLAVSRGPRGNCLQSRELRRASDGDGPGMDGNSG